MERRGTNVDHLLAKPPGPTAVSDEAVAAARGAFADWLRAHRETRGISLDEVARVTKIQIRTLERLEDARFDELPADVFVRGFLRNYARVVGIPADEALGRYDDCGVSPGPAADAARAARAMLETVSAMAPSTVSRLRRAPEGTPPAGTQPRILRSPTVELAAGSLRMPTSIEPGEQLPVVVPEPVVDVAPVIEAGATIEISAPVVEAISSDEEPKPKKARRRRGGKGRSRAKKVIEAIADEPLAELAPLLEPEVDEVEITVIAAEPSGAIEVIEAPAVSAPVPAPVVVIPPSSFRARLSARGVAVTPIPTLSIDDDDPESAERLREARADHEKSEKRSFLPQALLDASRGGRQGGLTLAVIILLIVATLTLSYLMRRPSAGGEGITLAPTSSQPVASVSV
jgi:hypothetical protein